MSPGGGGERAVVPPQATQEVWAFTGAPGFRRSIQTASSVAATLLAGFAFTFFVLVFRSLGATQTVVHVGVGTRVITDPQAFSAAPEIAAALFLLAGLLFLGAVQAGITVGHHDVEPSKLVEVYPEFVQPGPKELDPRIVEAPGWFSEGWPPMWAGGKWYAGWIRRYYFESTQHAVKWARWTRHLYHAALVALLFGVTVLVMPPNWSGSGGRWLVVAFATLGAGAELIWSLTTRERGSDSEE